jgi:L-alanine-DL-glutamate epimerase-like enolase superfamily enzyme
VKSRTIGHVDVYPVQLPVTRSFQFASGSAGTAARAKLAGAKAVRMRPGRTKGSDTGSSVALSYTVIAHDADAASDEVRSACQGGFEHFNFKAAVAPATEMAVARAIRNTAGPGAFVWADANQGFDLPNARRVANEFANIGVDVLEQPTSSPTHLRVWSTTWW